MIIGDNKMKDIIEVEYGEIVTLLLEPPLNMMSFIISVKFRGLSEIQILEVSSGIIGLKQWF